MPEDDRKDATRDAVEKEIEAAVSGQVSGLPPEQADALREKIRLRVREEIERDLRARTTAERREAARLAKESRKAEKLLRQLSEEFLSGEPDADARRAALAAAWIPAAGKTAP